MFGPLIRLYAVTKFARTLGILTASGTQILYCAQGDAPGPGQQGDRARDRAGAGAGRRGRLLAAGDGGTEVFPEMLVQMTATGEETGQLDKMLSRTADYYEQRVTAQVDGLSSLIEPIAIWSWAASWDSCCWRCTCPSSTWDRRCDRA